MWQPFNGLQVYPGGVGMYIIIITIIHYCHRNDDGDQDKATWTQLSSPRSLLRNASQAQTSFPGDGSEDHLHCDGGDGEDDGHVCTV